MAFSPIPRSISSSSSSSVFLSFLPRFVSTTPTSSSSSAAAAEFWRLLRSNSSLSNLGRTLSSSKTNLDPSVVESVLRSSTSSSSDRALALHFFVWAGLRPRHRHSAAAYSFASDALQLSRHPHTVTHALDSYAAADASAVSLRTFNILLNLCRHANLPDEALSLLRRMPEFGCRPDTSSYNVALRLLADGGRSEDITTLFEEMRRAGLRPNMVSYVLAVRGLCAVGRIGAARGLVKGMRADGCVPNVVVYSALLDGTCSSGDLDAAMEVLGEMESDLDGGCAPNVVTYTCLIKCLCEMRRLEDAVGVLDRMGRHGCSPNRVTVATLVNEFCARGDVSGAYELIERVIGEGSVSSEDCYSLLVVCLLRTGYLEGAEGLVRSMLVKGVRPDGLACNSLIRQLCELKRYLDVYHWIEEIEEKGLICIDSDVYSRLLLGLCENCHLVEASTLGRKIIERGIRVEAAYADTILEVLTECGEADLASRIASLKGS